MISTMHFWGNVALGVAIVIAVWASVARLIRLRESLARPPISLQDTVIVTYESEIGDGALRLTVRTRTRRASFLVPREMVYQMSDDLLRAAAQLGKREQPQRGPE
jgi:hypothetical protein